MCICVFTEGLTNLTELYLNDNPGLFGNLDSFSNLFELEVLDVSNLQTLTGDLSAIGELTRLVRVQVDGLGQSHGLHEAVSIAHEHLVWFSFANNLFKTLPEFQFPQLIVLNFPGHPNHANLYLLTRL